MLRILIASTLILQTSLSATILFKDGQFYKEEEFATETVQKHYSLANQAFEKKEWQKLIEQALILKRNFADSPFASEVNFFLGVSYYHLNDSELANRYLSRYLERQTTPKNFEEAIRYKLLVAKSYHNGSKKHLWGFKELPQWIPAGDDALEIYDEVITTLPNHDLAAEALFGKANLHFSDEHYKEAVETFQTLIRRFPKHTLAIDSYLRIADVYLEQSQRTYPDPDFLDLAYINLRRFRQDFPKEERLDLAHDKVEAMEEVYASHLYEIGKFYERTKKDKAAAIYYGNVVNRYPRSDIASLSHKRLTVLSSKGIQIDSFSKPDGDVVDAEEKAEEKAEDLVLAEPVFDEPNSLVAKELLDQENAASN